MIKLNLYRFGVSGGDEVTSATSNLSLNKPSLNDKYDINDYNNTLDTIDNAIGELQNRVQLIRIVLLTNSKKSAFNPQDISISNLSYYDEIEVFFWNWTGGHYGIHSVKVPVENNQRFSFSFTIMLFNNDGSPSTPHYGGRLNTIDTTNNKIKFGKCYGVVDNSTPPTVNSDQAWGVPAKIIGYKYI